MKKIFKKIGDILGNIVAIYVIILMVNFKDWMEINFILLDWKTLVPVTIICFVALGCMIFTDEG